MNKTMKIMLLALPAFAVLVMFFLVPLGSVLVEPFLDRGEAFFSLWSDPLFLKGLKGSTLLALTAGVLSVLVGVPVALRLSVMKEKARLLAMFCISLPLTFSGLIVAYNCLKELFTKSAGSLPDEEPEWSELGRRNCGE